MGIWLPHCVVESIVENLQEATRFRLWFLCLTSQIACKVRVWIWFILSWWTPKGSRDRHIKTNSWKTVLLLDVRDNINYHHSVTWTCAKGEGSIYWVVLPICWDLARQKDCVLIWLMRSLNSWNCHLIIVEHVWRMWWDSSACFSAAVISLNYGCGLWKKTME